MKIIHVVLGKANPERMNGVNKVAYQLAKNQTESGHDVTLWGIAGSTEHNYPPRNFTTKLFRQRPEKFRLDQRLVHEIRQVPGNAIFHLHGAFIPEFYLLSKHLRKKGIPYIYTPHGSLTVAAMQQSKWQKKVYFSLFERKLITGAKAVQLLGDQEFSFLDTLVKIDHKVLIPNGMDLSELPSKTQKNSHPHPVFNFCGRLDAYHKGLDIMLKGFSMLLQKGYKARLELIGDGKDRNDLEKMALQLGIADHVVFHGARYGKEKYQLMARGDVFLHTSRMEGFPMAVLEAAALGKPCLTSEPTNINRYIREHDAGFAMKGNPCPEQVCLAMEKALHARQKNTLQIKGDNAQKMVRKVFDWKNISRNLAEVYTS